MSMLANGAIRSPELGISLRLSPTHIQHSLAQDKTECLPPAAGFRAITADVLIFVWPRRNRSSSRAGHRARRLATGHVVLAREAIGDRRQE